MKALASATFLAAALTAVGAQAQEKAAGSQTRVDPKAYAGLWYEVARTPTPFQEPCDGGVTASYEIVDPRTVRVLNRCDRPDGSVNRVEGTAKVVGDDFRRLKVDFPQTPDDGEANFVIEAVGPGRGRALFLGGGPRAGRRVRLDSLPLARPRRGGARGGGSGHGGGGPRSDAARGDRSAARDLPARPAVTACEAPVRLPTGLIRKGQSADVWLPL
ncbi:lipocalin family protein [Microvirga roseola]|nr:lipocalin family protein [Microvirga roseola]